MAGKLLKYLPKPTSFSIPSNNINTNKATFSGPIVSIVPKEARRKNKSGVFDEDMEAQEPTSPKVSCIGQVKHKKNNSKNIKNNKKKHQSFNGREEPKMKKKPSAMQGMFQRKVRPGQPPVVPEVTEEVVVEAVEGRMRRYKSGRDTLADFDWRKVVVVKEKEEEEEVMVAHSGPMVMGGGGVVVEVEKRKEVNLWKRRTAAPPVPLQVN